MKHEKNKYGLWCKIVLKIGVEQNKSNTRITTSIYTLLGT